MPIEVIMPKVDMDMASGTIAQWHHLEGQIVEKGDALFDIETDKATMEVESPATGTLQFITAQKGVEVPIGEPVAWIFSDGEAVAKPANLSPEIVEAASQQEDDTPESPADLVTEMPAASDIRATPLARRIAKLEKVDLTSVQGSGPRGRIVRKDVDNWVTSQLPVTTKSGPQTAGVPNAKATADKLGIAYSQVPVDRMRATIAARLTESKSTIPHFYLNLDCHLDALLKFRSELNQALEAVGSKRISINDMLVRACALSLAAVPEANASWADDCIIRYADANISVAVAIEGGLITPVVKMAQSKSMQTISSEITDLATRAKSGKLLPNEYQGGSFSISNLGMFGIKSFTAIINPPESMILAVGKATTQFIVGPDGGPVPATILSVTLSCDHRVVDGALGAKWLEKFQSLVENPILLTLDPIEN
ncbi:MAG: pyruvate dehydrogenase complex dihydrolipoamide acetyltransferase, partial [Hyphomicrobiales bacterium]